MADGSPLMRGDEHKEHAERERDEWARDRDTKLCDRASERTLELGDAAEEPERDPIDLDPFATSLESVSELVQEDREEEEERRDDRHRDVSCLRQARIRRGKDPRRQRPDDQGEDDEPAPVDAKLDPGARPNNDWR
jgi:hypothetical protein